jgi:hypothetical protein
MADAGYVVLSGCMLERSAYRKVQNVGYAVTETSFANLNIKADALIQALIDKNRGGRWPISPSSNDETHSARRQVPMRQAVTWPRLKLRTRICVRSQCHHIT